MRLVEIRLLDGPSVYRLEPAVKVEVAVGRTRAWHGSRAGDGSLVRLGRTVPAREWPDPVVELVAWIRRLRADHGRAPGPSTCTAAADAGRWIVTYPFTGAERSRTIAEAALDLTARSVSSGRRVRLTNTQARWVAGWAERIDAAPATPPTWIRDDARRMPVISITGTNGKSTVTRLITHILKLAGHRVGTTTSDGILVDEQMVDPGDWTGPGGAAAILRRGDVDIAVLETARGGLVQRGLGYESNDASVLTNISADHLDLGGIHTLAELAEVKATVCRVTRPDGWVVLNADDPLAASVARRVRARVAWFTLTAGPTKRVHGEDGQSRCYAVVDGTLVEHDGRGPQAIIPVGDAPVTLGGLARHNVANALAAAAGARALGATIDQVAAGLRDFRPSPDLSPGRLNLFTVGLATVIVDFAHNEAGTEAILLVARGLAAGAPVTAIIGTAGDRPDDTLIGVGRLAGELADRVVIKETRKYLRGRAPDEVVGLLRRGLAEAGANGEATPVYASEVDALGAELRDEAASGHPRVVVLFCHEQRAEVFELLDGLGAKPLLDPLAGRAGDR
ncbi:MAG: Mur ligase family protein [Chloroflexota bacterium]